MRWPIHAFAMNRRRLVVSMAVPGALLATYFDVKKSVKQIKVTFG